MKNPGRGSVEQTKGALVWQRLVEGKNICPSDTIFLKHELYELTIMREKGYNYEEAHELTNKIYNWWKVFCEEGE